MNNLNLLGQLTAPTTVGPGDLLGHMRMREIMLGLILVALVAQLVMVYVMIGRELNAQAKERKRRKECQEIASQSQGVRSDNTNADIPQSRHLDKPKTGECKHPSEPYPKV